MEVLKIGDTTVDGWEVVDVKLKPQYKLKKRIRVIDDFPELGGKEGWLYTHSIFKWLELDGLPDKKIKLRHDECIYDIINYEKT